ncbi:MAG: alcohol dehydrogenase catalytic domain-containing protein [Pirellulaceae bacterium]
MIRVDRTGICGTDVHIYKWDSWAQKQFPYRWWWGMSSSAR